MTSKLKPGQHIHLVGIGGSGLSAIARVLLGQGYRVTGSDKSHNELTDALALDGATVYQGHDTGYIAGADALIITSAVKDDHVEVQAARAKGIPVYKRQDIMADLMTGKKVIAVAGTKGKTTTTSMIVHILCECGLDPSYIVGGVMGNTGTNAGVGKGDIFVVEADEYDNMFLGLRPDIAVITNIEWDHPDFFKTPEEMVEAFERFVGLLSDEGVFIGCAVDIKLTRFYAERWMTGLPATTYGLNHLGSRWRGINLENGEKTTSFDVIHFDRPPEAQKMGCVQLSLPGEHNVLNAIGALVVSNYLHIPFRNAAESLSSFKSTSRRFEVRVDVNRIAIVDDYAHNPMSIRAVLDAARQRYPDRAIWAVWQPHTYSRTQALFDDFVRSFEAADHVLVTDIYAAREQPLPGVTSASVVAAMRHPDARHTPTFANTVEVLSREVQSPAVVIIMSAGDAPQIGIDYMKRLGVVERSETHNKRGTGGC